MFIWYLPDIVVFTKNSANYIFTEATVSNYRHVEIKLGKKISLLPQKYAMLAKGERDYRVELLGVDKKISRSMLANDENIYVFDGIENGKYKLRVSKELKLEEMYLDLIEASGESVFSDSELVKTTVDNLDIHGDLYVAAVVLE